jgi:4-hydroxy-tetrahydrodipicolinate synthase
MKTPLFTGSAVAIVTPFRDGKIDFDKLGELIELQIKGGTQAIVVCGTTGEASTQNDEEHLSAVGYTVKKTAGRIPVIAGTGTNDTNHCLELSREACKLGADALMIVTPYYNKTTQHGLVRHYYHIADRADKPIILYHIPLRCVMGYTLDTYKELARHERIIGVKEASGDYRLMAQLRASCPDFQLWSGNDNEILPIMSLGGLGVISVATNIIPEDIQRICKLWLDGNVKESEKLFLRAFPLLDTLGIEVNPVPVKAAMNLMGMDVGSCRMPLCDLLPKNLDILKKTMQEYGLKV